MNEQQCSVVLLIMMGSLLAVSIGSIQGLWVSSMVLSPFAAGGVFAMIPIFLLALYTLGLLPALCAEVDNKREYLKKYFIDLAIMVTWAATSVLIGAGLVTATNAIFPGAMLLTGSPDLVGIVIGTITPLAGYFAAHYVIAPLAEKVNEYIISPVIEKVKGSSASQEPDECECSL